MKERGLNHSAFMLKNEAGSLIQDLPSGSLVACLEKALAIEELERHKNEQDALKTGLPRCINEFRLNHPHDCIYDSISPLSHTNGSVGGLKHLTILSGHTGYIKSLVTRKELLLSGSIDGTIRMWRLSQNIQDYSTVHILPHILANQTSVEVVSIDYNQLGIIASLAVDGVVRLWSSEGVLFNTIQHTSQILKVEWDSSGMFLLATSYCSLTVWDSQGQLMKELINEHVQEITMAWWRSPSEFTVQTLHEVWAWRQDQHPVELFVGSVIRVQWSPSKTYLAIIQETQDECDIWYLNRDITAISFTSKDYILLTVNINSEIYFWDLESRTTVSRIHAGIGKIFKLVFRKDDEFLAACSDSEVQIWNMENLLLFKKFKLTNNINDIIWTDEAGRLAVAFLDKIAVYSLY
ncbi:hypothetical protein SteCoe_35238 [Stentor coeruleus]|uniref:Anaphase-promoting complex subunit 4 WD40 domain-containing protein n=1 Tax=Stentor coeruleus TaxID=5963 RepID=A0A1R2AT32_9CILI|nr:hypothetical protein SteCoe_35238 [Stentor coeruleus]